MAAAEGRKETQVGDLPEECLALAIALTSPRDASRCAAVFAEVAELVECTCLDIYGRLPASALTPATPYAAYLVYGSAEGGRRGLSFSDQETAVAVGGQTAARRAVCLWPDDDEASKFRGAGLLPQLHQYCGEEGGHQLAPGRPRLREDAWWEMEMGRLRTTGGREEDGQEQEVVLSFEALGWYPKRGLVIYGIEFRPTLH